MPGLPRGPGLVPFTGAPSTTPAPPLTQVCKVSPLNNTLTLTLLLSADKINVPHDWHRMELAGLGLGRDLSPAPVPPGEVGPEET